MPFGLKNAAQAFQRFMDTVCQGLDFIFVYVDDILVASKDATEHEVHLRQLFQPLQEHGLVINVAKCQFCRTQIYFLGHRITSHGATPLPDKVEAICQFKQPVTPGVCWYGKLLLPLPSGRSQDNAAALVGKPRILQWSDAMVKAFQDAKTALARATMLMHPRHNAPTSLTVDASDLAFSSSWCMVFGNPWHFFSKQLRPPPPQRGSTVLSTGSCSHSASRYDISDTSWRARNSSCTRTTNPSHSAWPKRQTHGQVISSYTSHTSPNLPRISGMFKARTTASPTHCQEPPSAPSIRE